MIEIEDGECMGILDMRYVTERIDDVKDLECIDVKDVDCVHVLSKDVQCYDDEGEGDENSIEGKKDED